MIASVLTVLAGSAALAGPRDSFTVTGGLYFPTDDVAVDLIGSPFWQLGANYNIQSDPQLEHSFGVGMIWKSKDIGVGDATVRMLPLTYTLRYKSGAGLFLGGGAGVYYCTVDEPYEDSLHKWKGGVHGCVGYDMGALALELRYSNVFNTRMSGFSVSAGAVF